MTAQNSLSYASDIQNVLIISEDVEIVNIWKTLFEQRRYKVISEANAKDGLQTARLLTPALIVLHLDIPNDLSLNLCRGLRAATDGTLLLLNSKHSKLTVSEYQRAGVDETIIASISPMALLAKSLTWLARQDWIVPRRHGMEMHMTWSG